MAFKYANATATRFKSLQRVICHRRPLGVVGWHPNGHYRRGLAPHRYWSDFPPAEDDPNMVYCRTLLVFSTDRRSIQLKKRGCRHSQAKRFSLKLNKLIIYSEEEVCFKSNGQLYLWAVKQKDADVLLKGKIILPSITHAALERPGVKPVRQSVPRAHLILTNEKWWLLMRALHSRRLRHHE